MASTNIDHLQQILQLPKIHEINTKINEINTVINEINTVNTNLFNTIFNLNQQLTLIKLSLKICVILSPVAIKAQGGISLTCEENVSIF